MCGLAGILYTEPQYFEDNQQSISSKIRKMTDLLRPRGPDSDGVLLQSPIALGHTRLAIIDLSDAGNQPMQLRPGGPILVFNGEIFNFQELKSALTTRESNQWNGTSDTEVILKVYEKWGYEGLKKLEGIFAIALWDSKLQKLILFRDRLGVKPLYYGCNNNHFAFASEIKSVLASGGIDSSLDEQALSEYMWYGNSFGDRTFYAGVRSLEPGTALIIENGTMRIDKWWRIEDLLSDRNIISDWDAAKQHLRNTIDTAVKKQLVADVPIGIFLSGGVDSSTIAAAAIKYKRDVESFAAGFDYDLGINELPVAQSTARRLGIQHTECRVESTRLQQTLETLATAHDEPFGDAANIPLYLMCQSLRGKIKVVLQGDGGDELFGGYRRYLILKNLNLWKKIPPFVSVASRYLGGFGQRLDRLVEATSDPDPAIRMALLMTMETRNRAPERFFCEDRRAALLETTDPFEIYRKAADRFSGYTPAEQMLLTDITVQLPYQFLPKVDRATMASGIEARVPLLDESVLKLAISIPVDFKVRGLQKKLILRESQRKRLPKNVLDGAKKGFGVPYSNWLKSSLHDFAKELLLDHGFNKDLHLCSKSIEQALFEHRSGAIDHGFILWKLLQISLWRNNVRHTSGLTSDSAE